jgi:hypothetical protein
VSKHFQSAAQEKQPFLIILHIIIMKVCNLNIEREHLFITLIQFLVIDVYFL